MWHFYIVNWALFESEWIFITCTFLCSMQLYCKFHRITSQNLPFSFFVVLEKGTQGSAFPQLLKLYKAGRLEVFMRRCKNF